MLNSCLEAVFRQKACDPIEPTSPNEDFEVIVVDNSSTDGSVDMVRRSFPAAEIVENAVNLGFARANNQGIARAKGCFILLLNPDTEMQDDALSRLVGLMDKRADAGAIGARLTNPDGTLQTSCYPEPTLTREIWRLLHLDAFHPFSTYRGVKWSLETVREVDVAQGACLLVRRDALDQVGLLDEDYFIYSEEVDLCYRLRQHGWRIYWEPRATVVHHGGQSTRQVAAEMFLRLYESKLLYFRKHRGQSAALAYKLVLAAAALARLTLLPVALVVRASARERYLAAAANYWRLIRALPSL